MSVIFGDNNRMRKGTSPLTKKLYTRGRKKSYKSYTYSSFFHVRIPQISCITVYPHLHEHQLRYPLLHSSLSFSSDSTDHNYRGQYIGYPKQTRFLGRPLKDAASFSLHNNLYANGRLGRAHKCTQTHPASIHVYSRHSHSVSRVPAGKTMRNPPRRTTDYLELPN